MKRAVAIAIFVALVCLAAPSAMAQAQKGSIRGEVTDSVGLVIPEAQVIAKNKATGEAREVSADPHGDFVFANLEAGKYKVEVSHAGFRKQVKKVTLKAGADTKLNIKLTVSVVITTVE